MSEREKEREGKRAREGEGRRGKKGNSYILFPILGNRNIIEREFMGHGCVCVCVCVYIHILGRISSAGGDWAHQHAWRGLGPLSSISGIPWCALLKNTLQNTLRTPK